LRDDDRGDEYDFSAACGGDAAGQLPDVVKRVMLGCREGVICNCGQNKKAGLDSMNKERFDKYIRDRYEPQVRWYDKKSILNKRLTYLFQIPIITMAAITPVFAALEYKELTIIFSACVAAGFGILKFCKFEDHWHNYRTTCETLRKEIVHYKTQTDVYNTADEPEKLFVERVESIISKENIKWVSTTIENREKNKSIRGDP